MEDKITKSLVIMPNFPNAKPFYRTHLKSHGIGLKEFSDTYQLGLTDALFGDKEGEAFGPHWAEGVVKKGHVIILFDFMIVLYIPTNITTKQYQWLYLWKTFLEQKEECVRAIVYCQDRAEYISCGLDDMSKIDYIYKMIDDKYNLGEKKNGSSTKNL